MSLKSLKVSSDGRFLTDSDGAPFFYLGDTAWQLFTLGREDADRYLRTRSEQKFNVIQAVIVSEFGGLQAQNAQGEIPFLDEDTSKPNEAFFSHVDWMVERAGELGLYLGLLPCWGKYVNNQPTKAPTRVFSSESAQAYGEFLGRRYSDCAQVFWILGGDSAPDDESKLIWRSMAQGLSDGRWNRKLMTYHPPGGTFRPPASSSSEFFHTEPWLDFNMIQSGHRMANQNYESIAQDYALKPPKPTLDAEPCYDEAPHLHRPENGRFNAWHVRQRAYWSLLAGACGHAYGHGSIWQFYDPERGSIGVAPPLTPWREALHAEGAMQMKLVRALLDAPRFFSRVPDQTLLAGEAGDDRGHLQAARGKDRSYALIYSPLGRPIAVEMGKLRGAKIQADWFDPRSGKIHFIGRFTAQGVREFAPPSNGEGNDWILWLQNAPAAIAT